jgi:hypothetical protein
VQQVELSAGENRIVTISMNDKDLSIWNSSVSNWQRWHGQFSLYECFALVTIAALFQLQSTPVALLCGTSA